MMWVPPVLVWPLVGVLVVYPLLRYLELALPDRLTQGLTYASALIVIWSLAIGIGVTAGLLLHYVIR